MVRVKTAVFPGKRDAVVDREKGNGVEGFMKKQKIRIFIMTHRSFTPPSDPMYVPLQVGRANQDPLGYLRDDLGDHISDLNAYYSELTGVYWLWKNYTDTDIIGICHYRRYLIAEDGHLYREADFARLLSAYDMVVTKKLELRMPYYDGFASTHDEKDLIETERVVAEKYPSYAPLFHRMVHQKETYFANMMVCSKQLYDQYCTWLFDILFEVQKRIDTTGYDNYRKRVYGFLSEFLLTVWIEKNGLHVYESCVGMSSEKYETEQIKQRLAVYFANQDIAGAKQYFLQQLDKRPDVLMEASDIRGELKLCMQVISTCEYEKQRGEITMVERGMSFEELLAQMKELNRFMERLTGENPDQLQQNGGSQPLEFTPDSDVGKQVFTYVREHPVSLTAAGIAGVVVGKLCCPTSQSVSEH